MGSGGNNSQVSGQTERRGLPPYQNKQIRGALGQTGNVYNQGMPQVEGISAPAGISYNAGPTRFNPAPAAGGFGTGMSPQLNPQTGLPFGNGSATGTPQFPSGGVRPGTVASPMPTSGGGVANTGALGNQLEQETLGGAFLNPNSNPALAGYANAADQGLVQNYMNATAPSTAAEFLHAGSFGDSSAYNQAVSNNEYQLANAIGNTNAQIYEPAYAQERQLQSQAINQIPTAQQGQYAAPIAPLTYQNQYNAGITGLTAPFYGYNQGVGTAPYGGMTAGQYAGLGLGLAGLALY